MKTALYNRDVTNFESRRCAELIMKIIKNSQKAVELTDKSESFITTTHTKLYNDVYVKRLFGDSLF